MTEFSFLKSSSQQANLLKYLRPNIAYQEKQCCSATHHMQRGWMKALPSDNRELSNSIDVPTTQVQGAITSCHLACSFWTSLITQREKFLTGAILWRLIAVRCLIVLWRTWLTKWNNSKKPIQSSHFQLNSHSTWAIRKKWNHENWRKIDGTGN